MAAASLNVEHAPVRPPAGRAAIRDLCESDIDGIIRCWHESSAEHLDNLGIDRDLLARATRPVSFHGALRTDDSSQERIGFAVRLDGEFVGYTLLNR